MKNLPHETCFAQVSAFFSGGNPGEQSSYENRVRYLDRRNYDRDKLVEGLLKEHRRLGAGAKALQNIEWLKESSTLVVITGQQAGAFTGPLYTLYKAITAIRLAEEQAVLLGRHVVPVFWVAGEDHDWAEIAQTWFLDGRGKPAAYHLPGKGQGLSVGGLNVPQWEVIAPQLADSLPESEFKADIMTALERITRQAGNLAEWFILTLQWLLQDKGMIFFNPLLPEFKALAKEGYITILNSHHAVRQALEDQTQSWIEAGFSPQIQPTGGEVNLFLSSPERRAILWNEKGFYLRGQDQFWSMEQLSELLDKECERFSPNVVTRPVVQDLLFPVLACVLGPGEMNYWAQLGRVFNVLGCEMPILYPRLSAVILTSSWQKTMESEQLTLGEVYQGLAGRREQRLRTLDQYDIDGRFAHVRKQIEEAYDSLASLQELHPQLDEWIDQNKEKVEAQIQYLEKKVWQAQRKRSEGVLKHWTLLEEGVFPNGEHQERMISPLSFLVRYGWNFVERTAGLPLIPYFKEQQFVMDFGQEG